MAKITGLGGVFLNLHGDQQALLRWYKDVLGLDVSEYGINLFADQAATLLCFCRGNNDAILNFNVDDLPAFMEQLTVRGVEVVQDIIEYPYGLFAQIKDIGGNVIELCQLDMATYRAMVEDEVREFEG